MKTVLYICIENSNRSQMAEAFTRLHGLDVLEAFSAGSSPSGAVNPNAIRAMAELSYDLTSHWSKGVSEVPEGPYDFVITMGCGDDCPYIAAEQRDDWALPDPKTMPPEGFNEVRDEIGRRVKQLIARIKAG
ncbi:MAG: arsenate reductase ArsC [Longimicrobiales bacterium]